MVGKNNMKDWHSAAANWNLSNKPKKNKRTFVQDGHKAGAVEW